MTNMIQMCCNFHWAPAQVTLHEIVQLQRLLGPGAHHSPLDTEAESRVEDHRFDQFVLDALLR